MTDLDARPRRGHAPFRLLAAAATVILLVAACSSAATPSPTTAPTNAATAAPTAEATPAPATITVGVYREISEAFLWNIGTEAAKYNITVKFSELGSYPEQIQGLTKGSADIVIASAPQVAGLASDGITNLKAVVGYGVAGQNLVAHTGVTITGWKDLEGKKVCAPYSTGTGIIAKIAMLEGGVNLDNVTLVQSGFTGTAELQLLASGGCDVLGYWSPVIDQAVIDGTGAYNPAIDINKTTIGAQNGMMVAGPRLLGDKALLVNFLKAFVASLEATKADTNLWASVAGEVTGAKPDVIAEALKHQALNYGIDVASIKAAAKYGPQFGYAKTDAGDAVMNNVDLSFLAEATGKSVADLSVPITFP